MALPVPNDRFKISNGKQKSGFSSFSRYIIIPPSLDHPHRVHRASRGSRFRTKTVVRARVRVSPAPSREKDPRVAEYKPSVLKVGKV